MYIIDFHSHILPGIDDGARNLETSLAMLDMIKAYHGDIMLATPHFYASRDRIDTFLERRENARDALFAAMEEDGQSGYPAIRCGAEVAFFDGISKAKDIGRLTIDGTNILLLEMPFTPWTDENLKEVEALIHDRGFRVLIAHLERFLWMPGNKSQAAQLLTLPVTIQINAEAFEGSWLHTRALVRMFKEGKAHVLGTDCHGAHHRIPNLMQGRDFLKKKAGADILQRIDEQSSRFLLENETLLPY